MIMWTGPSQVCRQRRPPHALGLQWVQWGLPVRAMLPCGGQQGRPAGFGHWMGLTGVMAECSENDDMVHRAFENIENVR